MEDNTAVPIVSIAVILSYPIFTPCNLDPAVKEPVTLYVGCNLIVT